MRESFLHRCGLAIALGFTTFGIARVGIYPVNTPQPRTINSTTLSELRKEGWRVASTLTAQGSKMISNSQGVMLINSKHANPMEVKMSLVPIRARSSDQLEAKIIAQEILRKSTHKGRTLNIKRDQFLHFKDKNQSEVAVGCIASGRSHTDSKKIARAIEATPANWSDRIQTSIGLKPLRDLSCLFIAISITKKATVHDGPGAEQAIEKVWGSLQQVLTNQIASHQ